MNTRASLIAALLAAMLVAAPVYAQTTASFRAFGEKPGLVALMDDFMQRLLADERTAPFFRPVNQAHVKAQLVEQFCELLGGPCRYEGADMKSSHQDLEIGRRHFNALVELLQQAMDARGVPFAEQNRLLAKLAPMHRDIVTQR
ncbi:group 1 truncated hemoglobin [Aquincola sp. S2]|uniref:Group 1 truncated hemoglobin n=1 Tax=Pseudaquabacterium terrae TaxID=2732868 RepID=A0ABX2EG83_9BURK|nr:group 1 truncated hemoglobin [Aquabacterium terrae]NRF67615.1 group 1 truncated hemoglobin [Aquabacterium terrae]